jgi:hypothetical protein
MRNRFMIYLTHYIHNTMTRSLFYSSLNAKMGRYRKDQNMQELLDELHNANLKEELEKDNVLFNRAANQARIDAIKYQIYRERHPELLLKKAKMKAEEDYLADEYVNALRHPDIYGDTLSGRRRELDTALKIARKKRDRTTLSTRPAEHPVAQRRYSDPNTLYTEKGGKEEKKQAARKGGYSGNRSESKAAKARRASLKTLMG